MSAKFRICNFRFQIFSGTSQTSENMTPKIFQYLIFYYRVALPRALVAVRRSLTYYWEVVKTNMLRGRHMESSCWKGSPAINIIMRRIEPLPYGVFSTSQEDTPYNTQLQWTRVISLFNKFVPKVFVWLSTANCSRPARNEFTLFHFKRYTPLLIYFWKHYT